MRSQKLLKTERGGRTNRAWLYSLVFAGKLSTAAIFVLLISFFIQPFHLAMANEAANEAVSETLPDEVTAQLPIQEDEDFAIHNEENGEAETSDEAPETINDGEEISDTLSIEKFESLLEVGSETVTEDEVSLDADGEFVATDSVDTETVVEPDSETETVDSEAASDNGTEATSDDDTDADVTDETIQEGESTGASGENNVIDIDTNSEDLIDGKAIEDGVNDLVNNVVNEVVTLTRQMVNDENYYQFNRQSCVAVGDGTYHCTSKERSSIDPDSAVYADRDAEGDMEIYMRTSKGEVKQLSDNSYDDSSPDMDLASMRVVWQRLIDGRYQIISYDLEEREETQLTFSRSNSMEPKVSKEGITWQAWDGNDWEIVFFDGQFTDQITDNEAQDVTPVIEDGYILWSVLGGEVSEARVYSIEGGEVMTIAGHEGGMVVNPRFVLVYDTKFDNGDVVTQGFDPVTGLAEPIATKPAELPNIPEPDPIGEIKALIQNKSTSKDKEVVTVPVSGDGGDLNLASTTTTSADTLDLNSALDQDGGMSALPVDTTSDLELGEYDLVITDEASSTNSILNRPYYDHGTTTINLRNTSSTQE